MRILFDARPSHSSTGIGRYTRTVRELLRGPEVWAIGEDLQLRSQTPIEEEFELPAILEDEDIDLLHTPLFHLPAILPCRSIITIHDTIPAARPDLTPRAFAEIFAEATEAAERADAIVCPSEHAKRDIVRYLSAAEERVHVIPECPAALFRHLDRPRERFLLIVGSVEPRKNPLVVLDALRSVDRPAIFAGPSGGLDLHAEIDRRGLSGRVRVLGAVPDNELVRLYNTAAALVFASLYEGFGLPVVEAFACGTPVIASHAASIPEVAGDAAALFDPGSPDELVDAIRGLDERAADLRTRGFARLESFTPAVVRRRFDELYARIEPAVPA